jgi:hypothetical protein
MTHSHYIPSCVPNTRRTPRSLRTPIITLTVILTVAVVSVFNPALTLAKPVKEIVTSHIGWEVDKTTHANICTVESKDECQPGRGETPGPGGGFDFIHGIAVNNDPSSTHYHHVYVLETAYGYHDRVQELTATGQFVSMFGWEVNETKDKEPTATQQEKNICTATSGNTCKEAVSGPAPGQLDDAVSITIDPATGNIYIAEETNPIKQFQEERIQEFSPEGRFLREIGREVNETTHANICTAEEMETKTAKCTIPAKQKEGTFVLDTEHEGFSFYDSAGQVLAFGGNEDLLYVGEFGRIQELEPDGKFKREILLGSIAGAKAGDFVHTFAVTQVGDIYVNYWGVGNAVGTETIYELGTNGEQIDAFQFRPRERLSSFEYVVLTAIAVDPTGRLAVSEYEEGYDRVGGQEKSEGFYSRSRGGLYDTSNGTLRQISQFANPVPYLNDPKGGIRGLTFNDSDEMFAGLTIPTTESTSEVIGYQPVPVAELSAVAPSCAPNGENESDVVIGCSLHGEVNPWGVAETSAWFDWGLTTGLGVETAVQSVCTSVCGEAGVAMGGVPVKGLLPDQSIFVQVVGEDANSKTPELLAGETGTFTTPSVPPRIVGAPAVSFVGPFSAVLSGMVNPENTSTTYAFQYAQASACETLEHETGHHVTVGECPGLGETSSLSSGEYRKIGTTLEVGGLLAGTVYRYRLFAHNTASQSALDEHGGNEVPEGSFTTLPAPIPTAVTGAASLIGTTTATISGVVNPDGQPAVYQFELGLYNGSDTKFGTVISGELSGGFAPVERQVALTGLQPGRTYAYRVYIQSGYGTSYGTIGTFTTEGLPGVLVIPAELGQLPVPQIKIPSSKTGTTVRHAGKPKHKKKKHRMSKSKKHHKARKGGK